MQITNYELGVIFPVKDEGMVQTIACWERPPKKYDLGEDKPWVSSGLNFRLCLVYNAP